MNPSRIAEAAEEWTAKLLGRRRQGAHALACVPMLFTVGSARIYEPFLESSGRPEKDITGSVWFSYADAAACAKATTEKVGEPFYVMACLLTGTVMSGRRLKAAPIGP